MQNFKLFPGAQATAFYIFLAQFLAMCAGYSIENSTNFRMVIPLLSWGVHGCLAEQHNSEMTTAALLNCQTY